MSDHRSIHTHTHIGTQEKCIWYMYENHNIVLSFQVGVPIEGRKVNKQGQ